MLILRPVQFTYLLALMLLIGGGVSLIGIYALPWGGWLGLVPTACIAIVGFRRPVRRWLLARRPFPIHWQEWLQAHVPFYQQLPANQRQRFERDVVFFIHEHRFEAVGGAVVTELLPLQVAAGAALLLHGRPNWELPSGRTILFHPDAFDEAYHGGDHATYAGMVHSQGPILFSIAAVERSWHNPTDGFNVVLHELAHLFDFQNTLADGVPSLVDRHSQPAWATLVREEMKKARQGRSLLSRYAGTRPAELFAVAVENFFERPEMLYQRHQALYEALESFFKVDPRVPEKTVTSYIPLVSGQEGVPPSA